MIYIPTVSDDIGSPMTTWDFKVEDSDRESILDYLKYFITEFDPILESLPEVLEIPFTNHLTDEDFVVKINTDPYVDDLRVYKLITNDNYLDVVDSLIKFDRKLALSLSLKLIERLSQSK